MKSLYSFFALIILMLILGACSDSSTGPEDSFQGQRFGNWLTTSETTAEWVGSGQNVKSAAQTSALGDTIYYQQPDGNELVLNYYTKNADSTHNFSLVYRDSRYSETFFGETTASKTFLVKNPFTGFQFGNMAASNIETRMLSFPIQFETFQCDSTYNIQPDINFEYHILKDDFDVDAIVDEFGIYEIQQLEGLYEAYEYIIVNTAGVESAMRALACQ